MRIKSEEVEPKETSLFGIRIILTYLGLGKILSPDGIRQIQKILSDSTRWIPTPLKL